MASVALPADLARTIRGLASRVGALERRANRNLPLYAAGALPASAPDGSECYADMGGFRYALRFNAAIGGVGAWDVVGGSMPLWANGVPSALASGSGWRRMTPTNLVLTLPYYGSYWMSGQAEVAVNVAASVIGFGFTQDTTADTADPSWYGTTGQSGANYRAQVHVHGNRAVISSGSLVLNARAYSNLAGTIQFARAEIRADPVYVYGVA